MTFLELQTMDDGGVYLGKGNVDGVFKLSVADNEGGDSTVRLGRADLYQIALCCLKMLEQSDPGVSP